MCLSVFVSLEQFELVTQLQPRLLPLLKTPLPRPLKAPFPHALRDSAKLCLLSPGFSQAAGKPKAFNRSLRHNEYLLCSHYNTLLFRNSVSCNFLS